MILIPRRFEQIGLSGEYLMRCHRAGKLLWEDLFSNLIVNAGLQHVLDVAFIAGSQVATWYLGLTGATPVPAAGDTMASHAGWTEFTTYAEAARQTLVPVRTNQAFDNSASKAQFTINGGGGTVGGAFLVSVNTKGGGTGTLVSCGALTQGNRAVVAGDVISLQYTGSAADDGV